MEICFTSWSDFEKTQIVLLYSGAGLQSINMMKGNLTKQETEQNENQPLVVSKKYSSREGRSI